MQRNPTKPLALEFTPNFFFQLNSSLVFAAAGIKYRPPSQAFRQMQRLKNKLTWQSLKQLQENKMYDLWDIFIYTQKQNTRHFLTYLCTLLYLSLSGKQTNTSWVTLSWRKGSFSTARTTKNQDRGSLPGFFNPFSLLWFFFSYFCYGAISQNLSFFYRKPVLLDTNC